MRTLTHKFVETMPELIEEGIIYVSISFEIAIHKCCCGCGNEVVTPLSPTGWSVTFNGESVSLYPSIGNWSFPCRSHYFITENEVSWAAKWSTKKIAQSRQRDLQAIIEYFRKNRQNKSAYQNGEQ